MPDGEIISELYHKMRKLYEKDGGPLADQLLKLTWNYGNMALFDPHAVAKEINGYFLEDKEIDGVLYKKGTLVPAFPFLQDDGSTSSGCWVYCASYTEKGNMAARRGKEDPTGIGMYPNWSWAWPVNRRIIYNRASVDKNGATWAPKKPVIQWDEKAWVGDIPDGPAPPLATEGGKLPFIMKSDGVASISAPVWPTDRFPSTMSPSSAPSTRTRCRRSSSTPRSSAGKRTACLILTSAPPAIRAIPSSAPRTASASTGRRVS